MLTFCYVITLFDFKNKIPVFKTGIFIPKYGMFVLWFQGFNSSIQITDLFS